MLYQVRLKGKIFNNIEYVQADDFYKEPLSGKIFFKDKNGKNVAMYDELMVESVKKVEEEMAESWQE